MNIGFGIFGLKGKIKTPPEVFSHETALMLYELSHINPAKIYITVPKNN